MHLVLYLATLELCMSNLSQYWWCRGYICPFFILDFGGSVFFETPSWHRPSIQSSDALLDGVGLWLGIHASQDCRTLMENDTVLDCLIHGLHCFYHSEWLCYEVFLTPTFFASCTTSFLHTVLLHFCGSVEFSELSKPKGLNRNIPLSHLAPLPGWHWRCCHVCLLVVIIVTIGNSYFISILN